MICLPGWLTFFSLLDLCIALFMIDAWMMAWTIAWHKCISLVLYISIRQYIAYSIHVLYTVQFIYVIKSKIIKDEKNK